MNLVLFFILKLITIIHLKFMIDHLIFKLTLQKSLIKLNNYYSKLNHLDKKSLLYILFNFQVELRYNW
jgi:hypothetical protein